MIKSNLSNIVFTVVVKYGGYFGTIEETDRKKNYFGKQVTMKLDSEYANIMDLTEDLATHLPWGPEDTLEMAWAVGVYIQTGQAG